MERLKNRVIHPFILTAYAVFSLLAYNTMEIKPGTGVRSLVAGLGLAALLYFTLKGLLKNNHRAGVLVTIFLAFFFTYGHVYGALKTILFFGQALGRHRLLIPVYLVFLAAGLWWGWKLLDDPAPVTGFLNIAALAALAFPAYQITSFQIRTFLDTRRPAATDEPQLETGEGINQGLPDIYYIILDAYARHDLLQTDYGYDNTPFLASLEPGILYRQVQPEQLCQDEILLGLFLEHGLSPINQ